MFKGHMSFLGIDLGTGGVRCVVANVDGFIETEFQVPLKERIYQKLMGIRNKIQTIG